MDSEKQQKEELLFVLKERDAATVVFLECNSYTKRAEIAAFLRKELTEYRFYDIDLTPIPTISLLRSLTEHLPAEIVQSKPVEYVVNVYGLENSLLVSEDGQLKHSDLTAQLNLERELLFRNVPYIIIIWADHSFFRTLQRESPDLWSWVVYKFRFESQDAVEPDRLPALPPERLPQRGNIAERIQRIEELHQRFNRLNLDASDKGRLLKDKITILRLLGEEYAEAFEFAKAEDAYLKAIALAERIQESKHQQGLLHFNLGTVYLLSHRLNKALESYQKALHFATKQNFGPVYHQLGMVYEEQRQWSLAVENYHKSLEWKRKTGNEFALGSTYHHLGMVYEKQRQWPLALENYRKALEWNTKTGNEFVLGNTYHQLGRVYQEQRQYDKAIEWYQKSVENLTHFGHPNLKAAQESLARVQEAQRQQTNPDVS